VGVMLGVTLGVGFGRSAGPAGPHPGAWFI